MPVDVGIDGNEAFEQAKKTLEDIFPEEGRSVFWQVVNNTGFAMRVWGAWALGPSSFVDPPALPLPALIDGKCPSQIFGIKSTGKTSRAIGIVTYIIDFKALVDGKDPAPNVAHPTFMLLHCYGSNPHSHNNQVHCEIDFFTPEVQGQLICQSVFTASGETVIEYLKIKYKSYDAITGHVANFTANKEVEYFTDVYRIDAWISDDPNIDGGNSHHQKALFVLSRKGFTPPNPV